MVQQTLKSPTDLLHFQLRTALTMENDSLAALGELATRQVRRDQEALLASCGRDQGADREPAAGLPAARAQGVDGAVAEHQGHLEAGGLAARASAPKLRDQVALSAPWATSTTRLRLPGTDRAGFGDGTLGRGEPAAGGTSIRRCTRARSCRRRCSRSSPDRVGGPECSLTRTGNSVRSKTGFGEHFRARTLRDTPTSLRDESSEVLDPIGKPARYGRRVAPARLGAGRRAASCLTLGDYGAPRSRNSRPRHAGPVDERMPRPGTS